MKNLALVAVLALLTIGSGVAVYAQPAAPGPAQPDAPTKPGALCGGSCPAMGMGRSRGAGTMGMMIGLPAETQKKLLDEQMKFIKNNASIRTDLAVRRLEMRQLWLDSTPDAEEIIAQLREINKLEMQLKENQISNRLAIYKVLPPGMRSEFLKGCCGGMGPMRGGMGMPGTGGGINMGMGSGMGKQRLIVREMDINDSEGPGLPGED